MILGDHGPQTTIDEDLKALGMEHLLEGAGTGRKKKMDDDREAAPRQDIPVRSEDEDEDEDDDEIDEDIADIDENSDDDIDEEEDEDDDEDDDEDEDIDEDEDEDEDEDDPQMEAAWDVIEAFQQQLQQVQEGDDDARPSYDDLVGVVEAYEYIAEGKKKKKKQSNRIMTASGRLKSKTGAQRRAGKRGAKFLGKGKQMRGTGAIHAKKSNKLAMHTGRMKHVKGGKKVAVTLGMKKTARMSDMDQSGDPIEELSSNLADLREAVTAESTLVEGLRSIHDIAVAFYERIANELQEDEEIDEDDARIALGRHLESIAEDARSVATLIAEDTADLDDAADDLQALAADLDDAMEAMKGIE
jgi:hypothetical protein